MGQVTNLTLRGSNSVGGRDIFFFSPTLRTNLQDHNSVINIVTDMARLNNRDVFVVGCLTAPYQLQCLLLNCDPED